MAERRRGCGGTAELSSVGRLVVALAVVGLAAVASATAAWACKGQPMSELPFAQGKTFATLDEYLAHLKVLGTMDLPYYEEVAPGRYQLISGRGSGQSPRFFTREQLLKKYGFAC